MPGPAGLLPGELYRRDVLAAELVEGGAGQVLEVIGWEAMLITGPAGTGSGTVCVSTGPAAYRESSGCCEQRISIRPGGCREV